MSISQNLLLKEPLIDIFQNFNKKGKFLLLYSNTKILQT